ncbi:MAG: hypothetical protein LBQ60_06375 [Bacteroidales bacterium]|nr:hypothetical protein [Bacteroidales bacterium]
MSKIFKQRVFLTSAMLLSAFVFSCSLFFAGCGKEEDEPLNEDILNSPELEEYIVAGADFKRSVDIFTGGLNKIDFSTLEVTYDADGRKVIHLPAALVGSVDIEEKIGVFNEKKEILQNKFPQIADFSLKLRKNYIRQSIQSSLNVKNKLLDLGISLSRPLLKSGTVENWTGQEDMVFLYSYLSSWVSSPDYVELYIIAYEDGSFSTWIDDRNTTNKTHITVSENPNTGKYYFSEGGINSPISWVAHTHRDKPCASKEDKEEGITAQTGLPGYIYYQGGFYDYDYNPNNICD